MTNEHLDRLIDDAREGAKEASAAGRFRLMARLESCADELVKLRDARTARDAEMRDERARTEAAESEVARLTARLATAEKAAHEWRERAEGKEDGTRCKSCGGGLDGPGWDCQWCGERAGA